MTRIVLALGVAAAALVPTTSASATCMPVFDRYGVSVAQCSAPGGPPATFVCYRDTCVVV